MIVVAVVALMTLPATAQYYSSDRRYGSYDRSRYRHTTSGGDVVRARYNRAGSLEAEFPPGMFDQVRLLIVDGPLNGDDIKFIRKICTRSKCVDDRGRSVDNFLDLDLADAQIVGGGSNYYGYRRAEHDAVGRQMFYDLNHLRSVVLPDRIRYIDDEAFKYCYNLEEVIMPGTVRRIGEDAFYSCHDLYRIYLPNYLEEIEEGAFDGCEHLKEIDIPDGVRAIGNEAFRNTGLSAVNLPSRLTTLGKCAFEKTRVRSLFIPAGTKIVDNSLGSMPYLEEIAVERGNEHYTSEDGVLYDDYGTILLYYPQAKAGAFTVPDGVTTISAGAMSECSNLTRVVLPESVTEIGNKAFYASKKLTAITMPTTLKALGTEAFSECEALRTITIPHGLNIIPERAFGECKSLETVTIPEGITTLNEKAFYKCDALHSVDLPASLQTIGKEAFRECKSLTNIDLPAGLTTLAKEAFRKTPLSHIDLPEGLRTIGDNALRETNLSTLTIPASVTDIGKKVTEKCKNLTSITCLATQPPTLDKVSNDKVPLFVPAGSLELYKKAKNWKNFKKIEAMP